MATDETRFEDRARAEAVGLLGTASRWPREWFLAGAKWAREQGCCTSCDGTGAAYDASTNGRCWDCLGTGHPHEQEPTEAQIEAAAKALHAEDWGEGEWDYTTANNHLGYLRVARATLLAAKDAE